jgi:hypothetical protein
VVGKTKSYNVAFLKIGELPMKRSVLSGLVLASLALPLGLAGCGGGGVEEGVPKEIGKTAVVPVDSIKADMASDTARFKKAAAESKTTIPVPGGK